MFYLMTFSRGVVLYPPWLPHFVSAPQGRTLLSYVTGAGSLSSKTPCLRDLFQVSRSIGARGLLGWPNSPAALTASLWAFHGTLWLRKRELDAPFLRKALQRLPIRHVFFCPYDWGEDSFPSAERGRRLEVEVVAVQASVTLEPLTNGFVRLKITTCKPNKLRETLRLPL